MGPRGGRGMGRGRQNWTPRNVQIVGRRGRHRRGGGYWGWGYPYPYYAYYGGVYPGYGCYAVPYPPYYVCPTAAYPRWGYPYYSGYAAGPWGGPNPWAYY